MMRIPAQVMPEIDGERVTPPCFHDAYTWIEEDWDKFGWELPKVRP